MLLLVILRSEHLYNFILLFGEVLRQVKSCIFSTSKNFTIFRNVYIIKFVVTGWCSSLYSFSKVGQFWRALKTRRWLLQISYSIASFPISFFIITSEKSTSKLKYFTYSILVDLYNFLWKELEYWTTVWEYFMGVTLIWKPSGWAFDFLKLILVMVSAL